MYNSDSSICTVSETTVDVQNEKQVQQLLGNCMKNWATAATKARDISSRSHSVFRLKTNLRNSTTKQTTTVY